MSPNLFSTQSFASPHGNAVDKNGWWEKAGRKIDFTKGNKRRREETTEKPTTKETQAVRAISATLGLLLFSLNSTSHRDAIQKNEWSEKAKGKREETTEKQAKNETWALRANSATLGSISFSVYLRTFPRHILLHRHMVMQ